MPPSSKTEKKDLPRSRKGRGNFSAELSIKIYTVGKLKNTHTDTGENMNNTPLNKDVLCNYLSQHLLPICKAPVISHTSYWVLKNN